MPTLDEYLLYFLLQLTVDDRTQTTDDKIYMYLHQLAFSPNVTISVDDLPPPYSPYLVTAYHLLFVKKDLGRAKSLFAKIKEAHSKHAGEFSYDEERLFTMLDVVLKHLDNGFSPGICDDLSKAINNIEVAEDKWAYFFKQLILIQLGATDIGVVDQFVELYVPVPRVTGYDKRAVYVVEYIHREFNRLRNEYRELFTKMYVLKSERYKLESDYKDKKKMAKYFALINVVATVTSAVVSFPNMSSLLPMWVVALAIPMILLFKAKNQLKENEYEITRVKEEICEKTLDRVLA